MMPHPTHHPEEALLVDYATGVLSAPFAAVIAAHLTLCPTCRNDVLTLERVGCMAIEEVAAAPLGADALETVLARLDEPYHEALPEIPASAALGPLPAPFQTVLRQEIARHGRKALRWRPLSFGLRQMILRPSPDGAVLRFVQARGGTTAPKHDHAGIEMTFVLQGGFHDETGHYAVGDFIVIEPGTTHRPVADTHGCMFVWASGGPIILPGLIGRLLNPFLR